MENIASLVNAIVAVPLLGMLFAALSREGGRGRVSNVLSVGIFTVLSNLVVLWRTALQMERWPNEVAARWYLRRFIQAPRSVRCSL